MAAWGGTVHSSAGTAEAFSSGTAVVTVSAATTATLNGLGDVGGQVLSGGDSYVFAGGLLTGAVNAGGDAYVTSYGEFQMGVTAGGDATLGSIGNMDTSVTASHDIWAISYGDLKAEEFRAGHDVVFVGAVGDISGDIAAQNAIGRIAAYGGIDDASISAGLPLASGEGQGGWNQGGAGSIGLVEAYGGKRAGKEDKSN